MTMHEYHFDMVGLHMVLRTPEPITISNNLQPFLCPAKPNADCTVAVHSCAVLPVSEGPGYDNGPDCYRYADGTLRIYHGDQAHGEPFAVTQFAKGGQIEIFVLPEFLSAFSGTSGIFNRIGMENLLLQHQGLLLHASLIEYAGKTIAFAGPSGVGKSTQAALWNTCEHANILNGDRAALRLQESVWHAYGSPYAGTSGIYCQTGAQLAAIVVLEQAEENSLQRLSPTQALSRIYPEISIHRWDSTFTQQAADLCLQLVQHTPVLLLKCKPDPSAVELLKKGLSL